MAKEVEVQRSLTPREMQQYFYELLGDKNCVVWDMYDLKSQHNDNHEDISNIKILEQKVGFALFGPPKQVSKKFSEDFIKLNEKNAKDEKFEISSDSSGYDPKMQVPHIKKVCNQIIAQNKDSKNPNELYMSTIFVLCVTNKDGSVPKHNIQHDIWVNIFPIPVFRVPKCVLKTDDKGDGNHCHLFIDRECRVYDGFTHYLKKNNLPKSRLVVPMSGIYNGDANDQVHLLETMSPSCHWSKNIVTVMDRVATASCVGATSISLATLAAPVGAVFLTAAAVTGAAVGAYSIVRASTDLADRGKHKQSIGIKDAEARNMWIGIVGGATGIVTGAASKVVAVAAGRGINIGRGGQILFNTTTGAGVLIFGCSAVYGAYQIFDTCYYQKEKPSALMVFQVTASLLFFTNSVVNFKTANSIIRDKQTSVLEEFKTNLRSNRHRKIFNKMQQETIRTSGENKGNSDIIRSIRLITNKDDFFAGAIRINKQLNANNVKISFSSDGLALLNGATPIDPMQFWASNPISQTNIFENLPPPALASTGVSKIMMDGTLCTIKSSLSTLLTTSKVVGVVSVIINGIERGGSIQDIICYYLTSFSQIAINNFLSFLVEFVCSLEVIDTIVKVYPPDKFVMRFFKLLYTFIQEKAYEYKNSITSTPQGIWYYMEQILLSLIIEGKVNVRILHEFIEKSKVWIQEKHKIYMTEAALRT